MTVIKKIGEAISFFTAKTTMVDADYLPIMDSEASNVPKKLSWAYVKSILKTYFDTLYQAVLVSGTNIKTVNSTSLLGSGNIAAGGLTYTTLMAMEDPQINVSSAGDSYTDTSGDTYAETTNQTRTTLSSTRAKGVITCLMGKVSAGTGTFQLWDYTGSFSGGTATTTSTTSTAITQISVHSATFISLGSSITIRVKNSDAGGITYIDSGGFLVGDLMNNVFTSTGTVAVANMTTGSIPGFITNIKIAVLRRVAGNTATLQLVQVITPYINTGASTGGPTKVNIGATYGTSEANTIITRTPSFLVSLGNGGSLATGGGLATTISAISGGYCCAYGFEIKAINI